MIDTIGNRGSGAGGPIQQLIWFDDGTDIKKINTVRNVDISGADVFTNNILSATGNLGIKILDGGDVGIGTVTPTAKLDVNGDARIYGTGGTTFTIERIATIAPGQKIFLDFKHNASLKGQIQTYLPGDLDVDFRFHTTNNNTLNIVPALTLTGNNNVGIGTVAPIEKLHIYSSSAPTIKIQSDGTNEESGRVSLRQSNNSGYDIVHDGRDANESVEIQQYLGGVYNSTIFRASGIDETIFLNPKNNGNVGINTATPNSTLSVNGSIAKKVTNIDHTDSPYSPAADIYLISVDVTTAAVSIIMPLATNFWDATNGIGRVIGVSDTEHNSGTYAITNNASGSDIIKADIDKTSDVINSDGATVWYQAISANSWKRL